MQVRIDEFPAGLSTAPSAFFNTEYFCSGTITEAPSVQNHNRFLVFFDNGYAMYVQPKFAYPVFDQYTLPADRLHLDHRHFLKDRFDRYPEQLVAKLSQGDLVEFYFDNQWFKVPVLDVDASLVKVELTPPMVKSKPSNRLRLI